MKEGPDKSNHEGGNSLYGTRTRTITRTIPLTRIRTIRNSPKVDSTSLVKSIWSFMNSRSSLVALLSRNRAKKLTILVISYILFLRNIHCQRKLPWCNWYCPTCQAELLKADSKPREVALAHRPLIGSQTDHHLSLKSLIICLLICYFSWHVTEMTWPLQIDAMSMLSASILFIVALSY